MTDVAKAGANIPFKSTEVNVTMDGSQYWGLLAHRENCCDQDFQKEKEKEKENKRYKLKWPLT